jgi:hypothetical protein
MDLRKSAYRSMGPLWSPGPNAEIWGSGVPESLVVG